MATGYRLADHGRPPRRAHRKTGSSSREDRRGRRTGNARRGKHDDVERIWQWTMVEDSGNLGWFGVSTQHAPPGRDRFGSVMKKGKKLFNLIRNFLPCGKPLLLILTSLSSADVFCLLTFWQSILLIDFLISGWGSLIVGGMKIIFSLGVEYELKWCMLSWWLHHQLENNSKDNIPPIYNNKKLRYRFVPGNTSIYPGE
jgi:hypothetical protein